MKRISPGMSKLDMYTGSAMGRYMSKAQKRDSHPSETQKS